MELLLYLPLVLLVIALFCYGIFALKVYLLQQKISEVDKRIALYVTPEQKNYEKEVFDYKRQIDDFNTILTAHRTPTNVFNFVEDNTLPTIWFSSFDMAQSTDEIRLAGEAASMASLSQQVAIFEQNKEDIKSIGVLNSQISSQGKIAFILDLLVKPEIFDYTRSASLTTSVTPGRTNSSPTPTPKPTPTPIIAHPI